MQKQIDSLNNLDKILLDPLRNNVEDSFEMQSKMLQNLFFFSGNPHVDRFIEMLQLKKETKYCTLIDMVSISYGKVYRTLELIHKLKKSPSTPASVSSSSLPFVINNVDDLKAANTLFAYLLAEISDLDNSNSTTKKQKEIESNFEEEEEFDDFNEF